MESYFSHDPNSYDMARSVKDKKGGEKRGKAVKLSTDAQSVAARERRHRISERFKILQSLVPGGSKMDTVSMLEEAIHYVKFLKAQIWLHQTMINCVDTDPSLFPFQTSLPIKSSAHNLYSQVVNMNGEVEEAFAGPSQQPGFAYSAGLQFEDNIPLHDDATLLY